MTGGRLPWGALPSSRRGADPSRSKGLLGSSLHFEVTLRGVAHEVHWKPGGPAATGTQGLDLSLPGPGPGEATVQKPAIGEISRSPNHAANRHSGRESEGGPLGPPTRVMRAWECRWL